MQILFGNYCKQNKHSILHNFNKNIFVHIKFVFKRGIVNDIILQLKFCF